MSKIKNEITPNEFRRFFPQASRSASKRNGLENSSPPSPSKPEQIVQYKLGGEIQGEKVNSGKVQIRIVSYRHRLLDEDDQCEKFFVDCCRYAGLIHSDSSDKACIPRSSQVKINKGEQQRVEIEITYL